MPVQSTKLSILTETLQEAQTDSQAAEERKEKNISVMHLSIKVREKGSRKSLYQDLYYWTCMQDALNIYSDIFKIYIYIKQLH